MIFKFLSYFDLFKTSISLYYNGQTKYSSSFGILCSLVIMGLLTYQFVNSDIFYNKFPYVVMQSIQTPHAERVQFNQNKSLVIALADIVTTQRIYDPSMFQVLVVHYDDYVPKILETAPCKLEDLNFNKTTFEKLHIDKAICLKNKEFHLEGYADEYSNSFVQILLLPCSNFTSNGICKPIEIINEFFRNKIFTVATNNAQFDVYDYENPFKDSFNPNVIYLDPSLIKSNTVYLKTIEIITENGLLLSYYSSKKDFSYDKNILDYELRKNFTSEPLVKWSLTASKEKTIVSRKYQKLPETLASISGLLQFTMIILFSITNFITYIANIKNVLNQLYNFENVEKENKENQNEKIVEIQKLDLLSKSNSHDSIKMNNNSKNKKDFISRNIANVNLSETDNIDSARNLESDRTSKIDEIIKVSPIKENKNIELKLINLNFSQPEIKNLSSIENQKTLELNNIKYKNLTKATSKNNDKLYLSTFEYIYYFIRKLLCIKPTKKFQLVEKAENIFQEEMDLINVLKRIHEIENLKLLLLDEDQMILFDYLNKPYISLSNDNDNQKRRSSDFMINSKKKKKINIVKSYQICKENQNLNNINKKLVSFCDKKVVEMLEINRK